MPAALPVFERLAANASIGEDVRAYCNQQTLCQVHFETMSRDISSSAGADVCRALNEALGWLGPQRLIGSIELEMDKLEAKSPL